MLEGEVHFLCDCVRYSFLREDLFSVTIPYFPEFSMLSSREKFLLKFFATNRIYMHIESTREFCVQSF